MVRFIMPIILIGLSVAVFIGFSNPFYKDIGELKAQAVSFDNALKNSKALENAQEKLTAKSNAIDPDNLEKLKKLLPENIDNIRLILEIEKIAAPFGMVLKDVKYSPTDTKKDTKDTNVPIVQGGGAISTFKDYGVWDLSFSTTGTYNNFLNFTRALENNLRIVDITSVQFSSDSPSGSSEGSGVSKTPAPESYKYDFKIKTYWLKN